MNIINKPKYETSTPVGLVRQRLVDKFWELDPRDEIVYRPRFSKNPETKELILIGIIARKQPRYFYVGEIAEKHRLLIVKFVKQFSLNGEAILSSIEFPYSIEDLEAMWTCMFDVWVKPTKKAKYGKRFIDMVNNKLRQAKLDLP